MKIEISNLPNLISNIVGVPVEIEQFTVHERTNRRAFYMSFMSVDLKEHTGIMKDYYESFRITSFNNNFTTDDNGEEIYWVGLAFSFTYKSGGTNGHTFKSIFYRFSTNQWFTVD